MSEALEIENESIEIVVEGNDTTEVAVSQDGDIEIDISTETVEVQIEEEGAIEVVIEQEGPQGAVGKSAYQIWLQAGNIGTEVDFINSLRTGSGGYKHTQSVPASIWAVNHNLGYFPAGIIVKDNNGGQWLSKVDHIDPNNLTIDNGSATFSGIAYIS